MSDEPALGNDDATVAETPATPADPAAPARAPGEHPDRIGRYRVLRPLGQGGMGVVYLAYDVELDRRVAVKLLRPAQRSAQAAAVERVRMTREAQAMAKLSHPNVCGVFEVGEHHGDVFVAMAFVEGQTLKDWLEDERSIAQILSVFIAAGRGLAAAHAVGLVHRDFKPANVMVGQKGEVVVLDFGLARAFDSADVESAPSTDGPSRTWESLESGPSGGLLEAPLTTVGKVMGTPAYMAPEQILGKVATPAADQYSLCVSLYEAVYGLRPFSGWNLMELYRSIEKCQLRTSPEPRKVPRWLRAVILRGLSCPPEHRFADMQALLAELSRDRARTGKLVAVGVVAATAIASAYAMGNVGAESTSAPPPCMAGAERMAEHWGPTAQATLEAGFDQTELIYAEDAARGAVGALDRWSSQWVQTYTEVCEATHVRGEQSEELLDAKMHCLDRRLRVVDTTVEQLSEPDPEQVAEALTSISRLPNPEDCNDPALVDTTLSAEERAQAASVIEALDRAKALGLTGRHDRAAEVAQEALAAAQRANLPSVTAEARSTLGWAYGMQGNSDLAVETLTPAYYGALAAGNDREAFAVAMRLVSELGGSDTEFAEAEDWLEDAEALLTRLGRPFDQQATFHRKVGEVLRNQGRYAEAIEAFGRGIALLEDRGDRDHDLSLLLGELGGTFMRNGQMDEAREAGERALALARQQVGERHPTIVAMLNLLAIVESLRGDPQASLEQFEAAAALSRELTGPEHPTYAAMLSNLGVAYIAVERYEDSVRVQQEAVEIVEELFGADDARVANYLNSLGLAQAKARRFDEAEATLRRGLRLREEGYGVDHPEIATSAFDLGVMLLDAGRPREAEPMLRRALTLRERQEGSDGERARTLLALARTADALDRRTEALRLAADSLAAIEAVNGLEDASLLPHLDFILERSPDKALEARRDAIAER